MLAMGSVCKSQNLEERKSTSSAVKAGIISQTLCNTNTVYPDSRTICSSNRPCTFIRKFRPVGNRESFGSLSEENRLGKLLCWSHAA